MNLRLYKISLKHVINVMFDFAKRSMLVTFYQLKNNIYQKRKGQGDTEY